MSEQKIFDVIIIGGGPAGVSAAIYTARAGHATLVIDKGLTAGALGMTAKISNYPGIPGPVAGSDILKSMRSQAQSFSADIITDKVIGVEFGSGIKTVFTSKTSYLGKSVILATGSLGRIGSIPGEKEFLGKGVSYCATCDAAFYKGKTVAVVGNNDESVEELLFLTRFSAKAYLITSTGNIPPGHESEINNNNKVTVFLNTTLSGISGETTVSALNLYRKDENREETLQVDGVFIYLQGAMPITDYISGQIELTESGCLRVNEELETAIPGVYAAGDVVCTRLRQAVIASSDGVLAALSADKYLRGLKKTRVDWIHS